MNQTINSHEVCSPSSHTQTRLKGSQNILAAHKWCKTLKKCKIRTYLGHIPISKVFFAPGSWPTLKNKEQKKKFKRHG